MEAEAAAQNENAQWTTDDGLDLFRHRSRAVGPIDDAICSFNDFLDALPALVLRATKGLARLSRWELLRRNDSVATVRDLGLSYMASLFVVAAEVPGAPGAPEVPGAPGVPRAPEVHIGDVPIMMGCNWDGETEEERQRRKAEGDGGYFVIGGHDRVLVSQERPAPNRVTVFAKKGVHVAEVRSMGQAEASTFSIRRNPSGTLHVQTSALNTSSRQLPIVVLLRALRALGGGGGDGVDEVPSSAASLREVPPSVASLREVLVAGWTDHRTAFEDPEAGRAGENDDEAIAFVSRLLWPTGTYETKE
jgi:hypothetical protein